MLEKRVAGGTAGSQECLTQRLLLLAVVSMVTVGCFWHAYDPKPGQGSIWHAWLGVAFERAYNSQVELASRLAALDIIIFATTSAPNQVRPFLFRSLSLVVYVFVSSDASFPSYPT